MKHHFRSLDKTLSHKYCTSIRSYTVTLAIHVNQQSQNTQKYPVQSHVGQKKTPHHKAKGY